VPYLLITEFKQINQTVLFLPKTNLTSLQQDAALLQLIPFNLFAFILQSSNCLECSRTSFFFNIFVNFARPRYLFTSLENIGSRFMKFSDCDCQSYRNIFLNESP